MFSKCTNFQSHSPKYREVPSFWNCNFYKDLYGELAIRNLTIIAIFKLMALRDTLVYDSDNWSTYYFWFALSSGVLCFCVWPSFKRAVLSVTKVYCSTAGAKPQTKPISSTSSAVLHDSGTAALIQTSCSAVLMSCRTEIIIYDNVIGAVSDRVSQTSEIISEWSCGAVLNWARHSG